MYIRGSLFACLFFYDMYTTHYIKLFLFICFKQCFMKVFTIFSWFKVWYIIFPPWIHENNKILVFHVFKGEKLEVQINKKIGKNSLLTSFKKKTPAIWDTLMSTADVRKKVKFKTTSQMNSRYNFIAYRKKLYLKTCKKKCY